MDKVTPPTTPTSGVVDGGADPQSVEEGVHTLALLYVPIIGEPWVGTYGVYQPP